MIKLINKLVLDLLKNPGTGRWSRKNVAGTVSFAYTLAYISYCTWQNKTVDQSVIMALLAMSAACLGLSSWEKANVNTTKDETIR